ncbi:MAG: hypothetical protein KC680_04410, partial [Candidatus Peregrinibacteria bacterium]|nr:hypothetical protein [Candidatus Peregrinibacteria bacterium]
QDQQIIFRYTGGRRATLDGWTLDNRSGGSQPVNLDGIVFRESRERTFTAQWIGISFTPERDTARLIAPDGTVVSSIAWNNPAPWQVVRPMKESLQKMPVEVVAVNDRSSLSVALIPTSFVGILPRVEKYWAHSAHLALHPSIEVALTGITVLRGSSIPLQEGEIIYLDPQSVNWDAARPVIDAYVYTEEGVLLQHDLLSRKLAIEKDEFLAMSIEEEPQQSSSSSSSQSSTSSLVIEQKIYTTKTEAKTPAFVPDPRGVDSRIISLEEERNQDSGEQESAGTGGLPWVLLFGQSVAWLLVSARRYI